MFLVKTSLVELISLGPIPFNFLICFIARCHLTLQFFLLLVLVMPYRFDQTVIKGPISDRLSSKSHRQGNTGMMAVQFGKKMGAKVIAVSKDNWITTDFGADYIISDYDKVVEQVNDITQGKMADVVLNSLGANTWENSFSCVGINGRWVTFGGLTGAELN